LVFIFFLFQDISLGEVDLCDYTTVSQTDEVGKKNSFKLFNESNPDVRPYYMCADNEKDMAMWMVAFKRVFEVI